ncbi:xylulokinase [Aeromicrobium sp. REDSEA-S38_B2]|uniref:xylulokinase n=1 Tax=Aeromicrobium sp. REDSEA-S38_B2 TaxID=1811528 RepID=UPI00257EABED|nr:xylulokinase [Aeromicrobium sp. REDSEA-S38_B2]
MPLVLGVDSSTQSTKAVLVDADDGTVVASRTAPHPDGTSVDPRAWLEAFDAAAGPLLPRAAAVAVGGQQHGMVALDAEDAPVHDALLWNDTRSAAAAAELVEEIGGPAACAEAVGSVLVASFTITKLRWLRDHEPDAARRTTRVLLPHDYLSWHAGGRRSAPATDRGDASGTGYYSAADGAYREDLLERALGHAAGLPRVAGPNEQVGTTEHGAVVAPGTGDNMAAALGLGLGPGDVSLSIGTSGVAAAVSDSPVVDRTGVVTGFADATGRYLPMATTLNAARILDLHARLLGVDHDELAALALDSVPGAHGLTVSPYYDGERTPNRPDASGTWAGLTTATSRADVARAAVEALLCSLADALDAVAQGLTGVDRVLLIGGGAKSSAVQALAPAVLGRDVVLPASAEYVALGAARQAAWTLSGSAEPPAWPLAGTRVLQADPTPGVRDAYAALRDRTPALTP